LRYGNDRNHIQNRNAFSDANNESDSGISRFVNGIGGKGGGRPDMAMAGGTQPENLAAALASVSTWVKVKL